MKQSVEKMNSLVEMAMGASEFCAKVWIGGRTEQSIENNPLVRFGRGGNRENQKKNKKI